MIYNEATAIGAFMDSATVWSGVLTFGLTVILMYLRNTHTEMKRIDILVNRTREELAKQYVTKAEVHADINRVIDRIEALDQKIDHLLQSQIWDGKERRLSR